MHHDEKPVRIVEPPARREAGKKKPPSSNSPASRAVESSQAGSSGDVADPTVAATGSSDQRPRPRRTATAKQPGRRANLVRQERVNRMMSKAELARRAGLSVLTIDRVEKGFGCRMDTKRKILEALGLSLADRVRVFGEEE